MCSWQQLLNQRVQYFFVCTNRKKMLLYALTNTHAFDVIACHKLGLHQLCSRKNAHSCCAKSFEQRAVFKLPHHIWLDAQAFKPVVNAWPDSCMAGGQQHGHFGKRLRKAFASLRQQRRRRKPAQGRRAQRMAVNLLIGVARCRPISQHHIKPVQCQVTQ